MKSMNIKIIDINVSVWDSIWKPCSIVLCNYNNSYLNNFNLVNRPIIKRFHNSYEY